MRILVITSHFPPGRADCGVPVAVQIAERLVARGEEVCVLTNSGPRAAGRCTEAHRFPVRRELSLFATGDRAKWEDRHRVTLHNRFVTSKAISEWAPDVAVIFGLQGVSLGPAQAAEEKDIPQILYLLIVMT